MPRTFSPWSHVVSLLFAQLTHAIGLNDVCDSLRLWAVVRSGLWAKLDVVALLESYGIAGGDFRLLGQREQAHLPGFRPTAMG